MKKAVAAGAVILFAGAALLSASFRKEDIKVHRLDNGLKILLLEHHTIPNIALYTYYRVGSRNERPGLTGVSHFIEHMMFNGTAAIGPGEFDRRMEGLGGSNNAFTGEDITALDSRGRLGRDARDGSRPDAGRDVRFRGPRVGAPSHRLRAADGRGQRQRRHSL